MSDPLLEWRKEFPVLDKTVYLISHSLGAMPGRTRDRLNEYADIWSTRSIRAWEEVWWENQQNSTNFSQLKKRFLTRESEAQILSPQPIFSNRYEPLFACRKMPVDSAYELILGRSA